MLSILIPVYNYDVFPLVNEVYHQTNTCNIEFEIIIIDDASKNIKYDSTKILDIKNVQLIQLKENIGRSVIRNLLAQKANYENLLFIDAGTFPKSKNYIKNYLNHINNNVTIGGMFAEENRPIKPHILRWLYTKKREANHNTFTTANFLIKKSVIQSYPFDINITTYGYEDFLFFKILTSYSVKLNFINNPVIHDCKEDAITFINKTEESLNNLKSLSIKYTELFEKNKIVKIHKKLNKLTLDRLLGSVFLIIKPLLFKNLISSYPSIVLFDLYKLGYFCSIKQKQ